MKVLAVANAGGHFIQLLRLMPAFRAHNVAFLSSKKNFFQLVSGYPFSFVPDANRNSKIKLVSSFFTVSRIVLRYRPDVIITTGAALGLMAIMAGKLCRAKTVWIDSIANVEQISLSGKLAGIFADRCYTQWPHLVNSRFIYNGNIIK